MLADNNDFHARLMDQDPAENHLRDMLQRNGYNRDLSPLTQDQMDDLAIQEEEATRAEAGLSVGSARMEAEKKKSAGIASMIGRGVLSLGDMLGLTEPAAPETPPAETSGTPVAPPIKVPAEGQPAPVSEEPTLGKGAGMSFGVPSSFDKLLSATEEQLGPQMWAGRQAVGGVISAIGGLGHAVDMVTGFFDKKTEFGKSTEEALRDLTKVGAPAGITENLMQSAIGFLLPMGVVSSGLKVAGVTSAAFRAITSGAVADFAFIDPDSPMLAEMVGKLSPELAEALTKYVGTAENDPNAERSFKQDLLRRFGRAAEGAVGGLLIEGLMHAARLIHASRMAKKTLNAPVTAPVVEATPVGKIEAPPGGYEFTPPPGAPLPLPTQMGRAPGAVGEPIRAPVGGYAVERAIPAELIEAAPRPSRLMLPEHFAIEAPPSPLQPGMRPALSVGKEFATFSASRAPQRPPVTAPKADKLGSAVETFSEFLNARGEEGFGQYTLNQVASRLAIAEDLTVPEAKAAMARVMSERMQAKLLSAGEEAIVNDITDILKADLGEEGSIKAGIVFALARMAGGAGVGAMVGDTPEEKIGNALIGAGIGLAASPALIKKLLPKVDRVVARHEGTALEGAGKPRIGGLAAEAPEPFIRVMGKEEAAQAEMFIRDMPDVGIPTGKPLDINFGRMESSDDVKIAFAQISEIKASEIAGARQLGTPQEATHQAAKMMGMTVEQYLRWGDGQMPLPQVVDAGREMMVASARRIVELRDLVRAGDRNAIDPLLRQFQIHGEIQRTTAGLSSNIARSMNIMKRSVTGEIEFLRDIERSIGKTRISGGLTGEKLAELLSDVSGTELAEFTRKATDPTTMGALLEWRFGMLLSNPKTWATNILGNTTTTLWSPVERFFQSAFSKDIHAVEALDLLYGTFEGFGDAVSAGLKRFRTGESALPYSASKLESSYAKQIGPQLLGVDPKSAVGLTATFVGNATRVGGTILETTDEFFKLLNYRSELRAQARRVARANPIEGMAEAQIIEDLMRNPNPAMHQASLRTMEVNTFTNSLFDQNNTAAFDMVRAAARHLQRFQAEHPAAKLIVPFVRTPTNLAIFAAERTPLLNLLAPGMWNDLAAGGARSAEAKAKLATSVLMGGSVAALAAGGYITGGGPASKEMREQMIGPGGEKWQPYSVYVPGIGYVSYKRLDPFGSIISTIANVAELIGGRPGETDQETLDVVTASVLMLTQVVSSQTYFSNFSQFLDAVRGGQGGSKAATDFLGNIAISFVSPSIVAEFTRTIDPYIKEVDGLVDKLRARTPGYSSSVPARVNAWGQDQKYGHGLSEDMLRATYRALSPIAIESTPQHPASAVTQAIDLEIRSPLPVIKGVELTPEQEYRYKKLAGNELKRNGRGFADQVVETSKSPLYQNAPTEMKKTIILRIRSSYLEAAAGQLIDEDKDLQAKVFQKQRERAQKMGGQLSIR